METILISAAIIGGIGLVIGLLLGFAGRKFAVEADERETAVRQALPGNNCGGCGYPGCDGLAAAIVKGEAPADACPVGGTETAVVIGEIMGQEVSAMERRVAFVRCEGSCFTAKKKYEYYGIKSCSMMTHMPSSGEKVCNEGCHGFGDCVRVCAFDAIHMEHEIAVVDREKCKSCGRCAAVCPQHLIDLVPYTQETLVRCKSKKKGKMVIQGCDAGCVSCMKCIRSCPEDAMTMEKNVIKINFEKCTNCGMCREVCPRNCIVNVRQTVR